jgi:single-stranded DNA-binding protein
MSNNGNSNGKPRFSNFVILTVQAASDGESRFAGNGNLWASIRAFMSQGKDDQGNYKPSLWFTVKGFTTKDGDQSVPEAIQAYTKGEKFTVKGRLGLEEWTDSEGNTRQSYVIYASHIEPFANGNGSDTNAGTLDDEP